MVIGDYVYGTSVNDNGLQILDISDLTNPVGVESIADGQNGADRLNYAYYISVQGNYAYVSSFGDHALQIFDLGGLITPTAEIGDLTSNDIKTDFLRVTQALVADSLNINTNALIGGSLSITGSASSSLISGNTNPALLITSGSVGIGSSSSSEKLVVSGNVYASSFIDDGITIGAPDYVFDDPEYEQLSLEEIENFTKEYYHLPWLTPRDSGPMAINVRINEVLEALENLFLRVFDLKDQVDANSARIAELEAIISDLTTDSETEDTTPEPASSPSASTEEDSEPEPPTNTEDSNPEEVSDEAETTEEPIAEESVEEETVDEPVTEEEPIEEAVVEEEVTEESGGGAESSENG